MILIKGEAGAEEEGRCFRTDQCWILLDFKDSFSLSSFSFF